MNGIVNAVSSLSNRLDVSLSAIKGELSQLRSKLDEEVALVGTVIPKVSAMERFRVPFTALSDA